MAKHSKKRSRGRPAYEPTEADRRLVETHVAFGTQQDDICSLIVNQDTGKPITGKTLRSAFAFEIKVGATRANARVVESLFHQAVGRPAQYDQDHRPLREELKPAVAAAIWWTKARMGWKETSQHELSGKNGSPIQTLNIDPDKLKNCSDAELAVLEKVLGRLQRGDGGGAGGAAAPSGEDDYAAAIDGSEGKVAA